MSLCTIIPNMRPFLSAGKSAATGASVARDRSGAWTTANGNKSSTREAESSGFTKKSILSQVIALHILKIYPKCELIEILSGIYDKKWKFSRENMKDFDKLWIIYIKKSLYRQTVIIYKYMSNTTHATRFARIALRWAPCYACRAHTASATRDYEALLGIYIQPSKCSLSIRRGFHISTPLSIYCPRIMRGPLKLWLSNQCIQCAILIVRRNLTFS